jgi:hypothetical protein
MTKEAATCRWCGQPFALAVRGGNTKLFCSAICRGKFHGAARRWAEFALAEGKIALIDLKRIAMPATLGATTKRMPRRRSRG